MKQVLKRRDGVIEMSNYSAFHIRDARSPSLDYLPLLTRSLMASTSLKCATNPPIVETAQSLIS